MSGGLLEKAQAKTDTLEGEASTTVVTAVPPAPAGDGTPILLILAATTLMTSAILLYMLGDLPDYSGIGVLALLIGSGALGFLHIQKERNGGAAPSGAQWSVLVVVYLLVAATGYVGAMDLGGRATITEVSYDEASDSVTLTVRYTSGLIGSAAGTTDVAVEVLHGDESVWSGDITVAMEESAEGGEMGTFSLNVDDFYRGNAYTVTGADSGAAVLHEKGYTVVAAIHGGQGQGISLPALNLSRTVTDVDQRVLAKDGGDSTLCGDDPERSTCLDGFYLYHAYGISSSSADASSLPAPIRGSYTIDASMTGPDGPVFTYPTMTVVGTHATWTPDDADPSLGDGVSTIGERTAEALLQGDELDDVDRYYFQRDQYLTDYGCYVLTIDVGQTGPDAAGGDGVTDVGHYLFEEHNEEGHTWETFEAVSSC